MGEAAIRSLLCETKPAGTWSLAVYLSDPAAYYNEEDLQRAERVADPYRYGNGSETDEMKKRDKEAFDNTWENYAKVDARQFMRADFQQATETRARRRQPLSVLCQSRNDHQ